MVLQLNTHYLIKIDDGYLLRYHCIIDVSIYEHLSSHSKMQFKNKKYPLFCHCWKISEDGKRIPGMGIAEFDHVREVIDQQSKDGSAIVFNQSNKQDILKFVSNHKNLYDLMEKMVSTEIEQAKCASTIVSN